MICRHIGPAIVCGARPRVKRCVCGAPGDLLCDFPLGNGKTCDAAICAKHACIVGADRHHCVEHANKEMVT